MRTIEKLLQAENNKKLGNHRVEHTKNNFGDNLRVFYYFYTPICTVNDSKRTFIIDSSYGKVSTTRACNSYRKRLTNYYEEVIL